MKDYTKESKKILKKANIEIFDAFFLLKEALQIDYEKFSRSFSKLYLSKDNITEDDIWGFICDVLDRIEEYLAEHPDECQSYGFEDSIYDCCLFKNREWRTPEDKYFYENEKKDDYEIKNL